MFKSSTFLVLCFIAAAAASTENAASASLGDGEAWQEKEESQVLSMNDVEAEYLNALHPRRKERESRKMLRNSNADDSPDTARRLGG
eukprot:CAMPEP_0113540222 /NCGR_PEP_ID=MMETSP0015_2-20120614/8361_1 /TAXON_ID=2838 /ORGANISM="Odontella" /LENGTH=86 /DNA_ID=CAMNT_0000440003 /DNA_START=259 /DNA_END=516 /DNA_ORIENTATION=+ /assembly_acc=CAM_ASM_000160